MIRSLLKYIIKNKYVQSYARKLYLETKSECLSGVHEVVEIFPLFASSTPEKGARINIVLPALSEEHVFGGIATALRFFKNILPNYNSARIIVSDESYTSPSKTEFYSDWPIYLIGEDEVSDYSIVVCGDRYEKQLKVKKDDYFIATAWWTAYNIFQLLEWQEKQYNIKGRRMVYLIQDFEPCFYAWSSRFALADSTYRHPERTIAMFNTHFLAEYFKNNSYVFNSSFVFEPKINSTLREYRQNNSTVKRDKIILVYGRPTIERNAFSIIVDGLYKWSEQYPLAAQWTVISAGEAHPDICLANAVQLKSLGKLSLERYAYFLNKTAIGVSLMISPHPSYPPLEMVYFGATVITNRFDNKNLSLFKGGFVSLDTLDPTQLASALFRQCEQIDTGRHKLNGAISEGQELPFYTEDNEFPNCNALLKLLEQ